MRKVSISEVSDPVSMSSDIEKIDGAFEKEFDAIVRLHLSDIKSNIVEVLDGVKTNPPVGQANICTLEGSYAGGSLNGVEVVLRSGVDYKRNMYVALHLYDGEGDGNRYIVPNNEIRTILKGIADDMKVDLMKAASKVAGKDAVSYSLRAAKRPWVGAVLYFKF